MPNWYGLLKYCYYLENLNLSVNTSLAIIETSPLVIIMKIHKHPSLFPIYPTPESLTVGNQRRKGQIRVCVENDVHPLLCAQNNYPSGKRFSFLRLATRFAQSQNDPLSL